MEKVVDSKKVIEKVLKPKFSENIKKNTYVLEKPY